MIDPPHRPPGAVPVQRVRGEHPPTGEGWRHDALAASRHSRLLDELREPLEDHDPERAERLCAEITRTALGDLAPALLLLPAAERRRARVLSAFALTLFDFAGQRGLEGDRLAEINRWEFALEQALDGDPTGQPIFVLMAAEEKVEAWRREALDRLFAVARGRALGRGSSDDARPDALAAALAEALVGRPVDPGASAFGAASIRVCALQRDRRSPSMDELEKLGRALQAVPGSLPALWRRPARYVQLVSRRFLWTTGKKGAESVLGVVPRLLYLCRAAIV